jgi:hypothetical protein
MTFTSATQTIESVLTDQGRDLFARSLLGQLSFQLSGFKAGRGGYLSDANPVWVLVPSGSSTSLIDPVHPLGGGVAPLVTIESPYPNVVAAVCRLNRNDALYGLGEIGLYARVVRIGTFAQYQYTTGAGGILFLAKAAGPAGNSVTFALTGTGTPNLPLVVTTVGTAVSVQMATDGSGVPTSTVQQIAEAIRTDPSANTVMAASATGTITTTPTANVAPTNLAGGTTPTTPYTVGTDYLLALANMPILAKTDKTVAVFRFILAL